MGALSTIGRGYTYIKAAFYTIVAIIMLILGIYMLIKERNTEPSKKARYQRLGIGLIVISILILLFTWLEVYLVRRSKIVADVEGVEGIEEISKVT